MCAAGMRSNVPCSPRAIWSATAFLARFYVNIFQLKRENLICLYICERLQPFFFEKMNNFNAEELGRVLANAVSSFLRPSGPQRVIEANQTTPSVSSTAATTPARSTPRSATGTSSHRNTQV